MIIVTIADILSEKAYDCELPDHCIYRVRDGDLVLYVGKTKVGITERILGHMGQGPSTWLTSQLGSVILDNLPESRAWQVDMLTLDDCWELTKKHVPYFDIDDAEQALIWENGPCLNYINNTDNKFLIINF